MRQERETCKRTKTQNIVTFYVITITKRSWAVIPAFKQLSLVLFESMPCSAFLHQSQEAHPQTCCFSHHDLENKIYQVSAQTCRSCCFSKSGFLMHVGNKCCIFVFVFFYFLLLTTKIPTKVSPAKPLKSL